MIQLRSHTFKFVLLAAVLTGFFISYSIISSIEINKWIPTFPYYISGNPLMKKIDEPRSAQPLHRYLGKNYERTNATLLSLVRNEELEDLIPSIMQIESTFNNRFNYPWTFINDVPFTEEFKKRTRQLTKAEINYEVIPTEQWVEPSWIDESLFNASSRVLEKQGVQYSSMISYHRMCRWNSGMFYKHPKMLQYRWYWRVEPKTHYFCYIDYDVFRFMEDNNKTYGFVINLYDSPESIKTLWPVTMDFVSQHPEYVHPNSAIGWLTDAKKRPEHNAKANGYSTCHFWSNFEIGDMNFWRSQVYEDYFNHLDRQGGFFYERWGDAPVHSVALGLFEDSSKIHWFKDIGYQHIPYFNCPNSHKCMGCIPGLHSDGTGLSSENCMSNWLKYSKMEDLY